MEMYCSLSQGSRLIGAEDIHASEILYGSEPFYDYLLLCHLLGAMSKIDTDNSGQQLRRQSYRQSQRKKKRIQDGPVKIDIDGKNQENQNQRYFQ
jgi:hypothetical protein